MPNVYTFDDDLDGLIDFLVNASKIQTMNKVLGVPPIQLPIMSHYKTPIMDKLLSFLVKDAWVISDNMSILGKAVKYGIQVTVDVNYDHYTQSEEFLVTIRKDR